MHEIDQTDTNVSKMKVQNLFSGELLTLDSYIQRLFYVLLKLKKNLKTNKQLIDRLKQMDEQCPKLFSQFIGTLSSSSEDQEFNLKTLEQKLLHGINFTRSLIWLKGDITQISTQLRTIINCYYDFCYDFHQIIDSDNKMKIQLPRTQLINISFNQEKSKIPKFYLSEEKINSLISSSCEYHHLEDIRNEQHQKYLRQGHQLIYEKSYKKALEVFTKASKIKITSQCLNLSGRVHSLLRNITEAK